MSEETSPQETKQASSLVVRDRYGNEKVMLGRNAIAYFDENGRLVVSDGSERDLILNLKESNSQESILVLNEDGGIAKMTPPDDSTDYILGRFSGAFSWIKNVLGYHKFKKCDIQPRSSQADIAVLYCNENEEYVLGRLESRTGTYYMQVGPEGLVLKKESTNVVNTVSFQTVHLINPDSVSWALESTYSGSNSDSTPLSGTFTLPGEVPAEATALLVKVFLDGNGGGSNVAYTAKVGSGSEVSQIAGIIDLGPNSEEAQTFCEITIKRTAGSTEIPYIVNRSATVDISATVQVKLNVAVIGYYLDNTVQLAS